MHRDAAAVVHSTKVTEAGTDGPFRETSPRGTLDPEIIKCSNSRFKPSFSLLSSSTTNTTLASSSGCLSKPSILPSRAWQWPSCGTKATSKNKSEAWSDLRLVGTRYTRASRFLLLKLRTAGKSHNQTRIRSNGLRRLVQIPIRRGPHSGATTLQAPLEAPLDQFCGTLHWI
jgi:hypothetical protein